MRTPAPPAKVLVGAVVSFIFKRKLNQQFRWIIRRLSPRLSILLIL